MRGRKFSFPFLAVMAAAVAGLSGCMTQSGSDAAVSDIAICCTNAERIPAPLIDAARPLVPEVGRVFAHLNWRKGYLLNREEAHQAMRAELQPLDVIVTSSKGRITGHTIPGLFTHALVYLGTEAELKRLGVWESREVKPFQKLVNQGKVFIEAEHDGVHLSSEHQVLNTDRAVVLRPKSLTPERRNKALRDYFTSVGMPFDFYFDVSTPDETFCAELVSIVMPELRLPVTELYGIKMILPESLPASALEESSRLRFVSYTRAAKGGWERAGASALRADIAAAWAPKQRQISTPKP